MIWPLRFHRAIATNRDWSSAKRNPAHKEPGGLCRQAYRSLTYGPPISSLIETTPPELNLLAGKLGKILELDGFRVKVVPTDGQYVSRDPMRHI